MKNNVVLTVDKRWSDRLRSLKARDIARYDKEFDDPLVIIVEETTIDVLGGAKISKSWANICKCLTQ